MTDEMSRPAQDVKAGEVLASVLPAEMLDALVKDAHAQGGSLGVQELLNQMTKAVLERALDTEMTLRLPETSSVLVRRYTR